MASDSTTVVGSDVRGRAAVECESKCRGVSGAACELDRLPAQSVATIARGLVAESAGKSREESGAKLDVRIAEGGEALLEQRHEAIITRWPCPHEATAVPRRCLRKLARQPEASRNVGSLEERLLRRRGVADAQLSLAK